MAGWLGGWVAEWVDGWVGGWVGGWMGGRVDLPREVPDEVVLGPPKICQKNSRPKTDEFLLKKSIIIAFLLHIKNIAFQGGPERAPRQDKA